MLIHFQPDKHQHASRAASCFFISSRAATSDVLIEGRAPRKQVTAREAR